MMRNLERQGFYMSDRKFKRVLLKLSGEALAAGADGIYNTAVLEKVAAAVKKCSEDGVQIGIVVGAGNIWRGRLGNNMDHTRADNMGMLATAINAIALQDAFINVGLEAVVMSAVPMPKFAEYFTKDAALAHMNENRVVVFACGLGVPYFSTDTAAVLRAVEIEADAVLMAKNIDGVYTADPKTDPSARRLDEITYSEILSKGLKVIDSTAASLANDNGLPCLVFGLDNTENIYRAVSGETFGTMIKAGK
jgi:uridylate kinase